MKKQRTLLVLLVMMVLVSTNLIGQDKQLKKADNLYKELKYSAAIPLYETYLKESKKKNLGVMTKLASCYRQANKIDKAEAMYQKIVDHPKSRPINYYYFGEILMAKGEYDKAKEWFSKFDTANPDDERGALMIEACERVKKIQPLYRGAKVEFLNMNTTGDDFSPMIYRDDLVFVTDYSPNQKGKKYAWTGRSFLKLMRSVHEGDGKYSAPENISKRINVPNKNAGPSATDGDYIYFTRNSDVLSKRQRFNMQIYQIGLSEKAGIKDIFDRGLLMNFCSANHNYMHPALTPSADTIYYVSDKPGGEGGTDIYVSYLRNDEWTRPENLGADVNTPENEGFPFIGKDGKLYFSSKGHAGFGGFDIFVAEKDEEGFFGNVRNLGAPINSPRDDTGFMLTSDDTGLFASSRREGNDDIYSFKHYKVKIRVEVVDAEKNNSINEATVTIKTNGTEFNALTDDKGFILNDLALNNQYNIVVSKEGYHIFSQSISTKEITRSTTIKVTANLKSKGQREEPFSTKSVKNEDAFEVETALGALELKKPLVLKAVGFERGKNVLASYSSKPLSALVETLLNAPTMKIEIGVHTDTRGNAEKSITLSQKQADAVKDFLVFEGIEAARIMTKGYGETQPLNKCKDGVECSEEEHTINNRVEVMVIEF